MSNFIKNSPSLDVFKKRFLEFFKVTPNSVFGIHNPIGLKHLTRLRSGLSHLREHKFKHNFKDTPSLLCSCQTNQPEHVEHFLLHCPNYLSLRSELFHHLSEIISLVTFISPSYTCDLLLYGNSNYDTLTNKSILELTINFIIASDRFSGPFM